MLHVFVELVFLSISKGLFNLICFTCQIYKGRLENGTYVAIRSLSLLKKHSIQNLKVRLDLLSKLHHPHLVGLLGHCVDSGIQNDSSSTKVFLVYEYLPNGNYRTHLSGQYRSLQGSEHKITSF